MLPPGKPAAVIGLKLFTTSKPPAPAGVILGTVNVHSLAKVQVPVPGVVPVRPRPRTCDARSQRILPS